VATDASIDQLGDITCQTLDIYPPDVALTAWLNTVKMLKDAGMGPRDAGAFIAVAVAGRCPDRKPKLPPA
jgi:hypothetical protein